MVSLVLRYCLFSLFLIFLPHTSWACIPIPYDEERLIKETEEKIDALKQGNVYFLGIAKVVDVIRNPASMRQEYFYTFKPIQSYLGKQDLPAEFTYKATNKSCNTNYLSSKGAILEIFIKDQNQDTFDNIAVSYISGAKNKAVFLDMLVNVEPTEELESTKKHCIDMGRIWFDYHDYKIDDEGNISTPETFIDFGCSFPREVKLSEIPTSDAGAVCFESVQCEGYCELVMIDNQQDRELHKQKILAELEKQYGDEKAFTCIKELDCTHSNEPLCAVKIEKYPCDYRERLEKFGYVLEDSYGRCSDKKAKTKCDSQDRILGMYADEECRN